MRKAFTLIELLSVVAVIAILAGIAVPNFLEAQVRSKIGRARVDMASLAAALRAYCADHNAYPPNSPEIRARLTSLLHAEAASPTTPMSPISPISPINPPDSSLGPASTDSQERARVPFEFLHSSGWDLTRLTTPVPYFARSLPRDPFASYSRSSWGSPSTPYPFVYINTHDFASEHTSQTLPLRYVLLSPGPSGEIDTENPLLGPFLMYDATNGSTSKGDLVHF